MASTYLALLRGINVGGKNNLPMDALKKMFLEAGCENVRSYIQSGNVVFTSDAKLAKRIPALISQDILNQFGYTIPIILRSTRELKKAVADNPYLKSVPDIRQLAIAFLAEKPSKAALASLDPNRSPGDEFTVLNKEIYLNLPNGAARSKLTNAYFDRTLKTICSVRNWNTTCKLHEMMAE